MEYLNAQLRQLQQMVARKNQLQVRCAGLRSQCAVLQDQVAALDQIAMKEEADVVRLEGSSLAAFFYHVVGKMDEKLDQERREAYAARVKYDAAAHALEAAEQDLSRCSEELAALALCEDHYRMCLEEKAAAIKASGCPEGLQILRLETCLQTLECQLKELNEAVDAGNAALFLAKNVQSCLEHAQDLGLRDIFGGLNTEIRRYDHLDDAQSMVEKLQIQLRRFQTELIDVKIDNGLQQCVEGFARFSDFFFDSLFADWAAMDQIRQAQSQLRRTREEIEGVLRKLDGLIRMTRQEMAEHRTALDTFIMTS